MNQVEFIISLILIQYSFVTSEAAIKLNAKVITGTTVTTTTSACVCKNRCFVTLTCKIASWLKLTDNSYECHSTSETQVDFSDDSEWNSYCKEDCSNYIINRDCVDNNGIIFLNGTVRESTVGMCRAYTCSNAAWIDSTMDIYGSVPSIYFRVDANLGCIYYPPFNSPLTRYLALQRCVSLNSVLVDIDLVDGPADLKSFADAYGLNDLWIGTTRSSAQEPWVQSYGSIIPSGSSLWIESQQNEIADADTNVASNLCVAAIKNSNFLLAAKPCDEWKVYLCQIRKINI